MRSTIASPSGISPTSTLRRSLSLRWREISPRAQSVSTSGVTFGLAMHSRSLISPMLIFPSRSTQSTSKLEIGISSECAMSSMRRKYFGIL